MSVQLNTCIFLYAQMRLFHKHQEHDLCCMTGTVPDYNEVQSRG